MMCPVPLFFQFSLPKANEPRCCLFGRGGGGTGEGGGGGQGEGVAREMGRRQRGTVIFSPCSCLYAYSPAAFPHILSYQKSKSIEEEHRTGLF
jgi:hypothetical protein